MSPGTTKKLELDPVPLYYQLRERIRQDILSGKLQAGSRVSSERELCEAYGVSRITAVRALTDLVKEGLLCRNQGKGTFVADSTAGKSSTVAVLIPAKAELPYYDPQMLLSIEDEAHKAGYNVMFCNTSNDIHKVDSYLEKLLQEKIAGIVYVPVAIPSGYYEENIGRIIRLRSAGVEVVLCDRNFLNVPEDVVGFELDCVYSDDIRGSIELTQHLLDNGRKKIALICPPMDSNIKNRIVGYRKTLADNDIPYFSELVRFVESYDPQEIADVVDKLVKLPDRPDAIFATNDRIAVMAMNALAEKGISIPQEIAIAGYDNQEMGQYLDCPLTTVDRDRAEMGRVAMELLQERIAGTRTTPRHVAQPTKLIVRESCGSPSKKHKQAYIATPNKSQKGAKPMIT
ncbi:MAG: GntR family transcriptional regulator [Phycisphaerae bacterium]|nr:GntR family transcriptional regulator [Phycisphaerae bacterium]